MPRNFLEYLQETSSLQSGRQFLPDEEGVNPDFLSSTLGSEQQRFFGMEIEVGESYLSRSVLSKALKAANITPTENIHSYHSGRGDESAYSHWRAESDCSVQVEIVSPIMADNKESWDSIEAVCRTLRLFGAITSQWAGNHIHVSLKPGEKPYILALAWFFKDAVRAVAALPGGGNRDTGFAKDVDWLDVVGGLKNEHTHRYLAVNFPRGLPTVEFRKPEASFDKKHLQGNVLLSSLIVQKAEEMLRDGVNLRGLLENYSEDSIFVLGGTPRERAMRGISLLSKTVAQRDFLLSQVSGWEG